MVNKWSIQKRRPTRETKIGYMEGSVELSISPNAKFKANSNFGKLI